MTARGAEPHADYESEYDLGCSQMAHARRRTTERRRAFEPASEDSESGKTNLRCPGLCPERHHFFTGGDLDSTTYRSKSSISSLEEGPDSTICGTSCGFRGFADVLS